MHEELIVEHGRLRGALLVRRETNFVYQELQELEDHGVQYTHEQRETLCRLIDLLDGEIRTSYGGATLTKDEAKAYVRNYGKAVATRGDGEPAFLHAKPRTRQSDIKTETPVAPMDGGGASFVGVFILLIIGAAIMVWLTS